MRQSGRKGGLLPLPHFHHARMICEVWCLPLLRRLSPLLLAPSAAQPPHATAGQGEPAAVDRTEAQHGVSYTAQNELSGRDGRCSTYSCVSIYTHTSAGCTDQQYNEQVSTGHVKSLIWLSAAHLSLLLHHIEA